MVEYKSLRENSTSILERDKALGSLHKYESILEDNLEERGW